jgi:hypothetical protein
LTAATRCQNQIFNIVEESSLAARYCVVLEELRREAIEQIERSQGLRTTGFDGGVASLDRGCADIVRAPNGDANIHQPATFGNLPGADNNFDFNHNLGNPLADFSSWVQFESMVRPCFFSLEITFLILTNWHFHRLCLASLILEVSKLKLWAIEF